MGIVKWFLAIYIFSVSYVAAEVAPEKEIFPTDAVREIWQRCYQQNVMRMVPPQVAVPLCDCFLDEVRKTYLFSDVKEKMSTLYELKLISEQCYIEVTNPGIKAMKSL